MSEPTIQKEATEEQILYANLLEKGMYGGLALLIITFILYIFNILSPAVPYDKVTEYWSLPVADAIVEVEEKQVSGRTAFFAKKKVVKKSGQAYQVIDLAEGETGVEIPASAVFEKEMHGEPVKVTNLLKGYLNTINDNHLQLKRAPISWDWFGLLGRGDFLNFLPIAILSGITILCYFVIVPGLFARGDKVYAYMAIGEVLILALAASGLVSVGH